MIKLKNIMEQKNDVHLHPAFTEKVTEGEQEPEIVKYTFANNHDIYIDGKLAFKVVSIDKKGDKTEIKYEKVN